MLDLDDLITFPTETEDGTLLPVVHVQWFLIEILIMSPTKTACLVVTLFFTIFLLTFLDHLLFSSSTSGGIYLSFFNSLRFTNIGLNNLLFLRNFLFLFGGSTRLIIHFSKLLLKSFELSGTESIIIFWNFISTHDPVKFYHTVVSWVSDVTVCIFNPLDRIFCGILLLISTKGKFLKHF